MGAHVEGSEPCFGQPGGGAAVHLNSICGPGLQAFKICGREEHLGKGLRLQEGQSGGLTLGVVQGEGPLVLGPGNCQSGAGGCHGGCHALPAA